MVRIPFYAESRLAHQVERWHLAVFADLLPEIRKLAEEYDLRMEKGELVRDALNVQGLLWRIADLIGSRGLDEEELRGSLNEQLIRAEAGWFKRFETEGQAGVRNMILGMELSSQEVFARVIEEMRALYLDEAVERVLGEQDDLKASFILRLGEWIEGGSKRLDVDGLIEEMRERSGKRGKLFARDQYSRMERSLSLATIQHADAPYVEVLSSNDARVRPTHREWNHQVFTPEGLLADERWKDYNCRCAFVARWDLNEAQKARFVA